MTPAYAVHNIDGRTRIHVPSKRRDEAWFSAVAQRLREFESIEYVSANPLTASILILHHGTLEAIAEAARAANLLDVVEAPRTLPSILGQASARLKMTDNRIHYATHGSLDLYSVMAFALAGIGVFQTFKKRAMPPAMTLLWYAYELARQGHRKALEPH
jgi:hypothetical protein